MFVTKLYYYHLSNQSNINLCQISSKVPKITFLLCRFSVYYLLPLCILLLVLVVAHLVWQNKSCWTSIILHSPISTYVKYQLKSPRSHFYFAGFLCITYCLCAYYCWCWLLRIWFGKTSPAGHQ